MLLSRVQNVQPGFSSQTTSVKLESFIVKDGVTLSFFDAYSPVIQRPRSIWEKVTREVLQERAELWERLAKL
jgi:hypothetical protein